MQLLKKGKLNIGFVDGQWGSGGKGKFNGTLALREKPDFAVSHNSVNASHIWVDKDGNSYKFQHLPTSVVYPKCKVVIGAGASICLGQLLKEIDDWDLTPGRLFIHPNAVVITEEDIEYEQKHLLKIASTMTGNGAAMGRKVMRAPGVKMASDFEELKPYIADTYTLIHRWLGRGLTGILETAQGFDLSVDHSMVYTNDDGTVNKSYPYCTCRNVDPLTFAGMTGIAHGLIGDVFLNLRTFPIRVGDGTNNKVDGLSGVSLKEAYAGDCYPDQEELSWELVSTTAGGGPLMEMTSLTKRKRRVFDFSIMQLRHITRTVQPHHISLNFVNYLDSSISNVNDSMSLAWLEVKYPKVAGFVRMIERHQYWAETPMAGKVRWLGTGPQDDHIITIID